MTVLAIKCGCPAGKNRDLAHLRHLMNFAVRRGMIDQNTIASVENFKEEVWMRGRPTEEEINHFVFSAEARIRPLFGFVRETGCRLSEALRVKRREILRDQRLVVFADETKTGKFRIVPQYWSTPTTIEPLRSTGALLRLLNPFWIAQQA